jgi:N6-L-threonylcarbamoyladenine synthase
MCTILALESSCDETSAAVYRDGKILTNIILSQEIHEKYGGVVPELASRAHQKNIVIIVDEALKSASVEKKELSAIAYTRGPGLIGALLVASSFAKGMSLALNIPLIGVDHLHAHILANMIDEPKPAFPFLCLLISGGHTQILKVKDFLHFEILGQTIDDAAGEAFDKAAKVIGLSYPGGLAISNHAKKGNIKAFQFPSPKAPGLNFSFSGLKTSFLYLIRDHIKLENDFIENNIHDLCASYQHRIVSYLLNKLEKASTETGIKEICLAGGVAANEYLRQSLDNMALKNKWNTYVPQLQYCTDNAAMVAITAYYKYKNGDFDELNATNYASGENGNQLLS